MIPHMTTKEIAQLTVSQRITLAEELWDSVSDAVEKAKPDLQDKEFVETRLAEIRSNKEGLLNWNVLKTQTRNRKKC